MAAKQAQSHETILVVDDEPGVRRACARMLTTAGFDVLAAESGQEALELCEQHREDIDLALIDVVMPGMSGRDLAERMRERWRSVKIVFMSGYVASEIGELGVMQRDAHFLGKPFSSEVLRQKVRDVLDGTASAGR
jgi:CheY-like chemotaxis protein